MKSVFGRLAFLAILTLSPRVAFAHTGVGSVTGFIPGFSHPFSGLDHILAMLGVGVWAAQLDTSKVWRVPLTFVLVMVVSSVLGLYGFPLPFAEQGIVLSIIFLGFLIAASVSAPYWASAVVVGVFAFFHGHAHGSEMSASVSVFPYICGFAITTLTLHFSGVGITLYLERMGQARVVRFAGATLAIVGILMVV